MNAAIPSQPLLAPATWPLGLAGPQIAWVRRLAACLWLAGAAMALLWLQATLADAWTHGGLTPAACVAVLAALMWLVLAWRVWRAWSTPHADWALHWLGPVLARKDAAPQGAGPCQAGGFVLEPWRAPVQVELVWDGQRWLLLKLTVCSASASVSPPQGTRAWLWVDEQALPWPGAAGVPGSFHQLRTLLCLPGSHTAAPLQGGDLEPPAWSMASWLDSFNPGSKLRRSVLPSRPAQAPVFGRVSADTDFPATQCLPDERPFAISNGERA